jgi:hypothetical protein
MLPPTGLYNTLFIWQQQTGGTDETYGQPEQQWSPAGNFWGYLQGESPVFKATGSQYRAKLHLRGLPPIGAADRIDEAIRGYRWTITGIQQDPINNEVVFEVFR